MQTHLSDFPGTFKINSDINSIDRISKASEKKLGDKVKET